MASASPDSLELWEKLQLLKMMKQNRLDLASLEERAGHLEKQISEKENQLKNLDAITGKSSAKKSLKFNKLQNAQGNESILKKLEEDVILN